MPLYGDGRQIRDWLSVEDHCAGIEFVLHEGAPGEIYNVGGGDEHENIDVAGRIIELAGADRSLLLRVPDRPGHDRRYALHCEKMEKDLGWKPVIPLEEGLLQTIAWYKKNSEWLAGVRGGDYRSYYAKYYENRDLSLHGI